MRVGAAWAGLPHFSPGPFSPSEDAVHKFVAMVGRGYLGEPMHLG